MSSPGLHLGVANVFPDAAQRFGGVGKARRANLPEVSNLREVFARMPAAALRDLRSLTETLLPHPWHFCTITRH
jgi:hypothetical protein